VSELLEFGEFLDNPNGIVMCSIIPW